MTARTVIRPIIPADVGKLVDISELAAKHGRPWRSDRTDFSPSEFVERFLRHGIGAQAVIQARGAENPEVRPPVGIVQVLSPPDFVGLDLSVLLSPDGWRAGWPMEGVLGFVGWVFEVMNPPRIRLETSSALAGEVGLHQWISGGNSSEALDRSTFVLSAVEWRELNAMSFLFPGPGATVWRSIKGV